MYYDYDCVLYEGTSTALWGLRSELGRKLRQTATTYVIEQPASGCLGGVESVAMCSGVHTMLYSHYYSHHIWR